MDILAIGTRYRHDTSNPVSLRSNISLLDYDALLIDVESWFHNELFANVAISHFGYRTVDSRLYEDFSRHLLRWNTAVTEFLGSGRPVFVFPYLPPEFKIVNGSADSPTILDFIALGLSNKYQACEGAKAKKHKDAKGTLWDLLEKCAIYRVVFNEKFGKTCMTIADTDSAVACITDSGKGKVVSLPCFDPSRVFGANQHVEYHIGIKAFFRSLSETAQQLTPRKITAVFKVPQWAAILVSEEEKKVLNDLRSVEDRVAQLHVEQNMLLGKVAEFVDRKALFCGQGDELASAAKSALATLGFIVENGPEGRDDLIAKDGMEVAVIEVKGRLNTSAAEKDAAQLEKWVSRYHEENDVEPKGILIVNGFAEVPLSERNQPVFPNQMMQYVRKKEMCLLSGLQLFCLVASQPDEIRCSEIRRLLLSTIGSFPEYASDEWKTLLSSEASPQP